jgi:hypothetical protein
MMQDCANFVHYFGVDGTRRSDDRFDVSFAFFRPASYDGKVQ